MGVNLGRGHRADLFLVGLPVLQLAAQVVEVPAALAARGDERRPDFPRACPGIQRGRRDADPLGRLRGGEEFVGGHGDHAGIESGRSAPDNTRPSASSELTQIARIVSFRRVEGAAMMPIRSTQWGRREQWEG